MTIHNERRVLTDERGPVLRYVEEQREGTPIADLAHVVSGRSVSEAAAVACARLPGWLLSTDDLALAGRLVMAGAKPRRHAVIMQCDLRAPTPMASLVPHLRLVPLPTTRTDAAWARILPSWRAAFPEDHPDHFAGDDRTAIQFVMRLVDGSELGPMHRSTTLLVDDAGVPVAGIIVNIRQKDPPWGGPWISDLWRDPALRGSGVGPMLLSRAKGLLAEDGHVCLGLAVSAGNAARRTYLTEGFHTVLESQTVLLPGSGAPAYSSRA